MHDPIVSVLTDYISLMFLFLFDNYEVPSWSWSYDSYIYNYLRNQYLLLLKLLVRIPLRLGVLECYSKLGIIWNCLHRLYTNYSKTEIFYELLIILKENYDFTSVFKLKRMIRTHVYLFDTHVFIIYTCSSYVRERNDILMLKRQIFFG
jgi:hypothetical protein